jgi:hypothetical protein
MFTFVVNKDTMKVIGLIKPCHRPDQKPAGSGPVSTSSFGPAAQAAKSSATPVRSNAHLALDLIDKTPLQRLSLNTALASARPIRGERNTPEGLSALKVGGSPLQN